MSQDESIRPRYGVVHRSDGSELLVMFITSAMKDAFRMVRADTEEPVTLHDGETFTVLGKMTTDQAVLYRMSGDQEERVGKPLLRGRKKGNGMSEENKKGDPKEWSPLVGLGIFAGFVVVLLVALAGIKAIFWGF